MRLWLQSKNSIQVTWKVLLDCLRELELDEAVQRVESKLLNRESDLVDAGLIY